MSSDPAHPHLTVESLAPAGRVGIQHDENFPVASWLCPPRLREPIQAIYVFARSADDIADEGPAAAEERLNQLGEMHEVLHIMVRGEPIPEGWRPVFDRLERARRAFALPTEPLHALLQAFEQDVRMSRDGACPEDLDALLDYCTRSAQPIGRLLLHLYGVRDTTASRRSDAICSALQLINFWQDLSVDVPRGRYYLPRDRSDAHGVDPRRPTTSAALAPLMRELLAHARALLNQGAPLTRQLPGRIGWELRLVVEGGHRLLDHMDADPGALAGRRPRLRASDLPRLLWRAAIRRPV